MENKLSDIWIGQKDLNKDSEFIEIQQKEFHDPPMIENLANEELLDSMPANRRDFLKLMGFGVGAAAMAAGCDTPVKRALPYLIKPDEIVPGVANYYASTFVDGGDFCSILVKTREGRPIKIEGNDLSTITYGGTSARAQASVLSLYDTHRYRGPHTLDADNNTSTTSWSEIDKDIMSRLSSASGVALITNTIMSPSAKRAISDFQAKYPSTTVVSYDPVSYSAILDANEQTLGQRVIPSYRLDKADYIVSFNADFLGTWLSPVEFSQQYAKRRVIKDVNRPNMSRHVQVEAHMSLSGSNADNRILVKPSEQGAAIAYLCSKIVGGISAPQINAKAKNALDKVASQLQSARGKSVVLCGTNNVSEQILVNAINNSLGNYGSTIEMGSASFQRQGSDTDLESLVKSMEQGRVGAVIFMGCNPMYDFGNAERLEQALTKVGTRVALAYSGNETTAHCTHITPTHHYLESWGDVEAKKGSISMMQPVISPLFDTRQAELSLLTWAGANLSGDQPYLEYVKSGVTGGWDKAIHDGVYASTSEEATSVGFAGDISSAARGITSAASSDLEVCFYENISVGNGQYSNNPWLQELPDPVMRTTWGNYLAVPVKFDGVKKFLGMNDLEDGDLVDITIGDKTMTVSVIQQFGQMPGTVALALGYGRTQGGACGTGVGVDVNDCLTVDSDGRRHYYNTNVSLGNSKGKEKHYSSVQYHHSMGVTGIDANSGEVINADEATLAPGYGNVKQGYQGSLTERSVIFTSNSKSLKRDVDELREKRHKFEHLNQQTLFPYEEYAADLYSQGHHWGLHVDLNACIGCGACAVACMAENNVPVVGKKEVARHHEMTWLRIDRYFYGDHENPNAVYQPMMCQHCDNAPCENVCPVNATNHSSEGLNQMAYNRCVGTRYCANNCPYKVRRFNWLDFTTADIFPANQVNVANEKIPFGADNLTRMVLNPDVTVRARGVIEKCSFCVQRIQEGKLTAKREGRMLQDGDVKSACHTACPTGAITFGDLNNKEGVLHKKLQSPLNYIALEEINVRSSVTYTMKVNNRDVAIDA